MTSLELDLNSYSKEDALKSFDMFIGEEYSQTPIGKFKLKAGEDTENEVIQKFLNSETTVWYLNLDITPSSEFNFDFNKFSKKVFAIKVDNSQWVTLEDLFKIEKADEIQLSNSNFTIGHLMFIIEKWRNGWAPKWFKLRMECEEPLDVDIYLTKIIHENTESAPVRVSQFKTFFQFLVDDLTEYCLLRSDNWMCVVRVAEDNKCIAVTFQCPTDLRYQLNLDPNLALFESPNAIEK
uniref:FBA_2 domain-containing protein n=1 Tax=Caenorhabditis tropicalis TaxID=1561998 RepID=A0A1I7TET6_9PELO